MGRAGCQCHTEDLDRDKNFKPARALDSLHFRKCFMAAKAGQVWRGPRAAWWWWQSGTRLEAESGFCWSLRATRLALAEGVAAGREA